MSVTKSRSSLEPTQTGREGSFSTPAHQLQLRRAAVGVHSCSDTRVSHDLTYWHQEHGTRPSSAVMLPTPEASYPRRAYHTPLWDTGAAGVGYVERVAWVMMAWLQGVSVINFQHQMD